nr:two-component regulator propeller domain-containing protein [uncultured Bacteroides sp.]
MRNLLLSLCMLFAYLSLAGQQKESTFTHYSSKNGLSQNTVMYMLQDHNDFLWFATWDGINRFDGYNFTTYKARPDNDIALGNNRINWMGEDKWGYLWLLAYDYRVYRFDPKTEEFEPIPAEGEWTSAQITKVTILKNGTIWFTCKDEGVLRITPHKDNPHNYEVDAFTSKSKSFQVHKAYDITLDSQGSVWLLSDRGLGLFKPAQKMPFTYFAKNEDAEMSQAFYASCEQKEKLYFSSDRGHIWSYDKKNGNFHLISLPTDAKVVDIKVVSNHELLACTQSNGLYLYDADTEKVITIEIQKHRQLSQVHIKSAYVDRYKTVWFEVAEPQTVCYLNMKTLTVKIKKIKEELGEAVSSNPCFHIHEDVFNNLWIHPYAGGFSRYDRANDRIVSFYNEPGAPNWKFSSKIHSAMSDKQGNLWLCTHSKGLEKISFSDHQFHLNYIKDCKYESLINNVRSISQDKEKNLWIGMKSGKISIYDKKDIYQGYLTANGKIARHGTPLKGVAYSILQDKQGVIWIGTRGEGLVRAEQQGEHYLISRFKYNEANIYSLSDNSIYSLYEDDKGILWVATFGGGLNYIQKEAGQYKFINYRNNLKNFPITTCGKVRHIAADHQGYIWLGTSCGTVRFKNHFKIPEDIKFDVYTHIPGDEKSLSNNEVHWVLPTKKDGLYLLTFGGGLCKFTGYDITGKPVFRSYTIKDGLASDVLLSAQEDRNGNLWISTEKGVCKFIPSTGYSKNFADNELGISEAQFNEGSSYQSYDGNIYFGTTHGSLSFHPGNIRISNYVPKIVFSKLSVMNTETSPAVKGSVLTQNINDTKKLILPHSKNVLTLTFSALDMIHTDNIRYRYKLENFDDDWIYSGEQQHAATYTNLPTGHYVFHVKSTNGDGVWCNNERTLMITVQPVFWETIWAYIIYIVVISGLTYITFHILFVIFRLKHEVSVEQKIADVKLRFFTDISHELRTPLTLIAGPLECVLTNNQLPIEIRKQLQLMQRNTERMLRLVTQILDFRKIQNHKMKLCVQQIEVVSFVQRIMENFNALAEEHLLDFVFYAECERIYLWADSDKLEKVIFNLLSNAFKYTPDGKMVKIVIIENIKKVSIEVQDQGIGIPENKRNSLFVRFEDHLNQKYFSRQSSGIGLSLVKELVDLHKGTIIVDSTPSKGSRFVVELLKGREHFDDSTEFILDDIPVQTIVGPLDEDIIQEELDINPEKCKQVMLLVEDNQELRNFLRHLFLDEYIIYAAANGFEGLSKALDILPDIIISDVMMPEMDGLEMVKALRKDVSTSHIPIVLLTAKTDIESRLQGLEIGADDYIMKPFSASYLKARIINLLQRRKDMQEFFTTNLIEEKQREKNLEKQVQMTTQDRNFLEKLKALIEKNLDNSELHIDDFVKEMAVSRTIFFKKLKALTGLGPNEFLKEMRIRKAAQLMENKDYNITQIAYMVGINGSRYFSRCFKAKYGVTPSEYRTNLTREY